MFLEYVVEETASGVTVRYARAHEYVQEKLESYEGDGSTELIWISMSSQDVYYSDGASSTSQERPAQPQLSTWTSPKIEVLEHTPVRRSSRQMLKPARRIAFLDTPVAWLVTPILPRDLLGGQRAHRR
jgi:hypothetical protein